MKVFKLKEKAKLPEYATEGSAAFDLRACFSLGDTIAAYNPLNKRIDIPTKIISGNVAIQVHPQYRVLIPTGLIFDIPKNNVLEIHPRSGTALKQGLSLANCTAIIDSDYVQETYIMLVNISEALVIVNSDDRIAQAILRPVKQVKLEEIYAAPEQKTSRVGGLGSTGTA